MIEDYPIDAILVIDDSIDAAALEYYLDQIGITALHVPTFAMAQEALERYSRIKIVIIMNNVSDSSVKATAFIRQIKRKYDHLLPVAGSLKTDRKMIPEMLSAGCQIEFNFDSGRTSFEAEEMMMKAVGVPEKDPNPLPPDKAELQHYIGGQFERTDMRDGSLRYAGIKTIELENERLKLSFLWAADVSSDGIEAKRNFRFTSCSLVISSFERTIVKTHDGIFNRALEFQTTDDTYSYRLLPPGEIGLLLGKVDEFFCQAG